MTRVKIFFKIAFSRRVFNRALIVALFVGILLNVINQGDKLIQFDFSGINYLKFALTFLVPYLVSTYSSTLAKMNFVVGDVAPMSAIIKCKNGPEQISINKGQIVPQCADCGDKTKWKIIKVIAAKVSTMGPGYESMALFAELNPAPVFRFGSKGTVMQSNPAANNIFGVEDLVGMNMFEILEGMNYDYLKIIENGEILTHFEELNNNTYRFELRGIPSIGAIQTYGADITEITEKELENKKYLQAIEQTDSSIMITDTEGSIQFVNRGFEIKSGYRKNEVIGLNPRILKTDLLPKEAYEYMWKAISSGKVWTGEFHNRRKDDTTYWEKATISPIKNQVGEIVNYMAVKEDITEQKKNAEAIESMALFAKLNPEPVFRFNCEGEVQDSNPAANEAFLRESIIRMDAHELLPELEKVDLHELVREEKILLVEEKIGEKIFRFIIRGMADLDVCQIYGSDVTLRRKAEREVRKQKQNIEHSIVYASRIQNAVLPSYDLFAKILPNYFVFFRPRDIVSGDFYWATQVGNKAIVVAADCTGHGVPGAFMSMLGISFLNEIVNKSNVLQANEILNQLRRNIKLTLSQTGKQNEAKDGMDMALCIIDQSEMIVEYAGAYNPLYLIREGELLEYKGDRMPIGIHVKEKETFTNYRIDCQKNDTFYIFSDGYVDQFGGANKEKYKSFRFKEMLLAIHEKPMAQQKTILSEQFDNWRGDNGQVDDVLVMGFTFSNRNDD